MSSKIFVSEEGALFSEEELETLATECPDGKPTRFTEVFETFETFENPGPGAWELERYEGWREHKKNFEEKIKDLKEEYEEWLLENPEENEEWVTGINWEDGADSGEHV